MTRIRLAAIVALATGISIDTVFVGNAGNVGEVQSQGTFGAVADDYRIGTTEVTNTQYAAFLNYKAASDPLGLFNPNMESSVEEPMPRSASSSALPPPGKVLARGRPVKS